MKQERMLVVGGYGGIGETIVKSLQDLWRSPILVIPYVEELDVSDDTSIDRFMYKEGPFNEIVYAAGVNTLGWATDQTYAELVRHASVNWIGFVYLMGAHERFFPDAKGRAVAIVSDASRTPMRGSAAYAPSKAALAHAIRCLARELAPRWQVNGVSPSIVDDTPMTDYIDSRIPGLRGWSSEKAKEYELSLVPMGRRATKSEVAEVVMSVLSAPEFMTGSIIELTGGK